MRVKRLEIQGFKSFKDKTVVHFDHGVTGIVGPNGCGKSNIVDAFFWVMGEQSYKHMRGSGSDDLIFNGSSKHAPLGMAEATLILDTGLQEDGGPEGASVQDLPVYLRSKEVSVTRRLYRGGEGEYFINGVPARLKDIKELFMDTGIGAKGYSVIEQGQIDKIVNSKPEDRRALIEEAAGIAKYKARKKESLRKLEVAQTNLSRLNDIVQEIERSLASLERQAQKARKYKEHREELIAKETTWGRRRAAVLKRKLASLRADREMLEHELVGVRAQLATSEAFVEARRTESLTETKITESLQEEVQELSKELAQKESALQLSRHRQDDMEKQTQLMSEEQADLQAALEIERESLVRAEGDLATANADYEGIRQKVDSSETLVSGSRRTVDELRQSIDQLQKKFMDLIREEGQVTSRLSALHEKEDLLGSSAVRAQSEHNEFLGRLEELQKIRERSALLVSSTLEDLQNGRVGLETARHILNATESSLQDKRRALESARRELTMARSRLDSLVELDQSNEGVEESSQWVVERAKEKGSHLSFILGLVNVQRGYESVFSSWLESRLNLVLSPGGDGVSDLTKDLSSQKKGRVSFQLSSSSSSGAASAISWLTQHGVTVVGPMSDHVTLNGSTPAHDLAKKLIEEVLIVESLETLSSGDLVSFVSEVPGISLVTKEGSVLESSGTFRGGSLENDRASILVARKAEIRSLEEQCSSHENTLNSIESEVSLLEESKKAQISSVEDHRSQLNEKELSHRSALRESELVERDYRDVSSRLDRSAGECDRIENEKVRVLEEKSAAQSRAGVFGSEKEKLESDKAEVTHTLELALEALRSHEDDLSSIKVQEASLRERLSSLRREADSTRSLIAGRERRQSELAKILQSIEAEKQRFVSDDPRLKEETAELAMILGDKRAQLIVAREKLSASSQKLDELMEDIKRFRGESDSKGSRLNHSVIEFEKVNSDLEHLTRNLEEKYGAGCLDQASQAGDQEEMENPVVTPEMSAEEERVLGEEVEILREKIRRLGEVNTMAVEEYEELHKRYDYLVKERTDLLQSIENLEEAIEHINNTSKERFTKAFEAIAGRFSKLFPVVFGGGSAELSLVYPEGVTDVLEAGVDIFAQPPGKKVVNIGLLSGGEKALTAISLLFAIFLVKPSPFCLLDEVDAPLDDSNIGKYNSLLREMSARTQFIIITHNKKTMELNDSLYGVTMEDPGVSKVVSIEMK